MNSVGITCIIFYLFLIYYTKMAAKYKKSESLETTWHSLIIAIFSIVVFVYRISFVAYPMFSTGLGEGDWNKVMLSLTMLV